jgi:ATP/maltotriose-dependent transcriptional regulator MalT/DNA-binding SARP family transcriptional activator
MGSLGISRLLVAGKLRPPSVPERLVSRPRVEGLIAAAIERYSVVFVIATAGAGKTTALVQAATLLDRPLAWVTVGEGDVAPGRLLEYVAAAISRHVPAADDIARLAMAAGVPHPEVAGLLVESAGDSRLLLILDEMDRIVGSSGSLAVVEALLRYAPDGVRVALASRRELPIDVGALQLAGRAGRIDEHDLALNEAEVTQALRLLDVDVDARAVLEATAGWVAGVMFEAWRSGDPDAAAGGLADPLHGYLARNLVGQLSDGEREMLLVTSVLRDVTAERARALGIRDARARLAALRERHLPATWALNPLAMRCHPRFREYLLEQFAEQGPEQVTATQRALGRVLDSEGHAEEAVESFLSAGALEEGAEVADRCIASIVERLDFELAERWLAAFADVRDLGSPGFVVAELGLCISTDDQDRGADLGDRLEAAGERDRLVRASPLIAAMLANCYGARGRAPAEARLLLEAAPASPVVDAVRYTLTLADDCLADADAVPPTWTGGPLDVGVLRAHYHRGELALLAEEPPVVWTLAVEPWRILALQALGQTGRALELFERSHSGKQGSWMAGVELMLDLGRFDEARTLLESAPTSHPPGRLDPFVPRAQILEAKIALREDRDTHTARRSLRRVLTDSRSASMPFLRDHADTWLGLAELLDGSDAEALDRLRRTVSRMTKSGLRLLLPAAAVYLAEAEWRAGEEEAADVAADAALAAAVFQGSNHILLQALTDFPSVVWRRADAEPSADSAWHRLARALRSPDGRRAALAGHGPVRIVEFGDPHLVVGDLEVRPRLSKAMSLLATLAAEHDHRVPRRRAIRDLFESGSDESTVAYLRLAVRAAREVVAPEAHIVLDQDNVRCEPAGALESESAQFEAVLAAAGRLGAAERLEALRQALAIFGRGNYLDGDNSPWASDRRHELVELAEAAMFDASSTAYELGEYREAERLIREGLARNPFRESGWRLLMRVSGATHDGDGVIDAYRGAERALAELGAEPSAATVALLSELRR